MSSVYLFYHYVFWLLIFSFPVQNDTAARSARIREDDISACIGWEAWQRSSGIQLLQLILTLSCLLWDS
jgi:hypothetical protein